LSLGKELTEVRKNLEVEASEHGMLCATIGVVCDDLGVAYAEGTSLLVAHVVDIMVRVGAVERDTFHAGINRSFMIARSHYGETISLEVMSLGYAAGYNKREIGKLGGQWFLFSGPSREDMRHRSPAEGLVKL
jgi:hypothetical protein